MACDPDILKNVPLFALLDEEERGVLASHVDVRRFAQNQRIYKIGDPGGHAYVVVEGRVRVSTIDEDAQELTLAEPEAGGFFAFASLLEGTQHQTGATAIIPTTCIEVDHGDLETLVRKKPDAAMDMLAVLGSHLHTAQQLARTRSLRNANEIIEQRSTFGEKVADSVARFGGSWNFIILFTMVLVGYTSVNVMLGGGAWDPYPFILLNLFLSMLAAIQAPVIMMSQNRQDMKDRTRSELDFEVNRRAEAEIRALSRKMHELADKLGDIEERLRGD